MNTLRILLSSIVLLSFSAATASVQLIYFTAQAQIGNVQLQWATLSEFNNAMFQVERSNNSENWSLILSLDGSGSSSIPVQYEAMDENPGTGTKYYRLRQMDIVGVFTNSDVISVYVTPGPPASFSVYPNPASGDIMIDLDANWNGKVCILNAIGQVMLEEMPVEGASFNLQIDALPKGMYYVQLRADDEKVMKKFFKE